MSLVAVVGSGAQASEWAIRYLAAGHDVRVDTHEVAERAIALWPVADRLGLFDGASLDRLSVGGGCNDVDFVQLVDGVAQATSALIATEATGRGCSPIHLVPLVDVAGPDTDALVEWYRSVGMTPLTHSSAELERWQTGPGLVELTDGDPDTLITVLRALRATRHPAGVAMAHHEAARFGGRAPARWKPGDVPPAPLSIYRTPVEPEWVDYNGHMTEAAYLTAAGWASDALFRYIGDDEDYRAAGHSFYTVETHIHYLREVDLHEPIEFATQIIGVDAKRVHLVHSMLHGDDGDLLATVEQMLVHVDMEAGRSAPILADVADALAAIAEAHASLPVPPQVGTVMRLPAART